MLELFEGSKKEMIAMCMKNVCIRKNLVRKTIVHTSFTVYNKLMKKKLFILKHLLLSICHLQKPFNEII